VCVCVCACVCVSQVPNDHYSLEQPDNILVCTTRRQIFFGTFDSMVHSFEGESIDTGALWSRLRQEVALIPNPEGTNGAATFGHITGGYDSQYYGYLFSEVYSASMFAKFKGNCLDKQLGRVSDALADSTPCIRQSNQTCAIH
jgi:hypothetical protein